jgi:hypothetical protein
LSRVSPHSTLNSQLSTHAWHVEHFPDLQPAQLPPEWDDDPPPEMWEEKEDTNLLTFFPLQ